MKQFFLAILSLFFLALPLSTSVVLAEEEAEAAEKTVQQFSKKAKKASRQFAKQLMEYKFLSSGERKRYLRRHPEFARMLKKKKGALKKLKKALEAKPVAKEESEEEGDEEEAAEEEVEEEEAEEESDAEDEESDEEDADEEEEEEEEEEELEDEEEYEDS